MKSFLFAAVVAATIALPSDRASAFLMNGAGVRPIFIGPGSVTPIISYDGIVIVPEGRPTRTSYTTVPGDKLRTKDGHGVLDRFGVSLRALREANPDALVPVCVNARLQPNGLTTCDDVHWFLRERVVLTIPRSYDGHGHHGITL